MVRFVFSIKIFPLTVNPKIPLRFNSEPLTSRLKANFFFIRDIGEKLILISPKVLSSNATPSRLPFHQNPSIEIYFHFVFIIY